MSGVFLYCRHLVLTGKKWELLCHNSELCPLNILPPCGSKLFQIMKNKRFYRGSSLSPIRWVSARVYSVNLFICLVSNGAGFVIFLSCNICGSNSQSITVIDATGVFCKFEEYIVHYWGYVVQNNLDTCLNHIQTVQNQFSMTLTPKQAIYFRLC